MRVLLFVLCPASREEEALRKTHGLENASIITWEDILSAFKGIKEISNPVAKIVMNEFVEYLKRHFSFIYEFDKKATHLKKAFPEYGTSLQRELVGKLWSLFPNSGGRLSNGKTWLGYYFYADPSIDEKGWFGFVPKVEIEYETSNQAELIVATTYKPSLSEEFKKIKVKSENFIGAPGNTNAWVIRFDSSWNTVDKWRDKISPFWNAIKDDIT